MDSNIKINHGQKICAKCNNLRDLSEFHKRKESKDGLQFACKICAKELRQKYDRENFEHVQAYKKKYYIENPHMRRGEDLGRYWPGLTVTERLLEYQRILDLQNGACAICLTLQSAVKRKLSVDHCHTTNKIRGLLCDNCNHLLGKAKDDSVILGNAIEYLRKHK